MVPATDNLSFDREAEGLNAALRMLRRRGFVVAILRGVAWTGAVLLPASVIFAAALGWWGGALVRISGWATISVGFLTAFMLGLRRPVRRLRKEDAVLLRIGEVYPHMSSDVRSAGQLARSSSSAPFSSMLVTAQIQMIREFLEKVIPEGRIFPKRALLPSGIALTAAVALSTVAWMTVPGVLQSGATAFFADRTPPVKSRRVSEKAPVAADLQVVLKYPEYLKREARKLDNVSGGFVAPLGTTVTLDGISLVKGAARGEAHLPDGSRVPLSVSLAGEVHGSFVVSGAGPFFISLGDDRLMVDGPAADIEVEPDAPPSVRLLRPTGRVEIREAGEVELEFEAEDDHGISRIDMVIHGGGHLETRRTAVRLTDQIRRFKTKYRWSPDSIRLDKDTSLEIALEAFDDDTILGPKPGRSESVEVRFLTPQSRHKNALEEQNAALDLLIDLLAFRMETPVPGNSKPPGDAFDRYAMTRGQTEDLLARTAKLIGLLNSDSLTPRRVVDTFVRIRRDLSNQLLFEGRLYEAGETADYRKRAGVDKVTCRLLERAILRVDDLVIEQQMSSVLKTGSALEASRGELAELLLRYKESRSESVRRGLLSAIEKLEREMLHLEKNIERIRGKVGDAYVNPSSMLRMDLLGSLAELRSLLAADNLNGALSLVRRMEKDLGRLLAGLEGGLMSFRTERFGEGERFLGALLDRVMAVESKQLQLRRETVALKRNAVERLNEIMKGKISPLVKRQTGRQKKMRRTYGKLDFLDDPTAAAVKEFFKNALRELGLALNQGDLDEARQVSEDILDMAQNASAGISEKNKPLFDAIKRESALMIDEIREAFPKPSQLLSDKDSRRAVSRALDQRLVLSKTRKLRMWIKKQAEEIRFLSSRAVDSLSRAADRMSQAAADLESKQVGRALEEQSFALAELAELREDLKRGEDMSPLESRPLVMNGRVDLPSPEDFEVPPEFRDDILEAMRGDLPNQYEDAIKKYYEALVQ